MKKCLALFAIALTLMCVSCSVFDVPGKTATDKLPETMAAIEEQKKRTSASKPYVQHIKAKYLGGGVKVKRSDAQILPGFFQGPATIIKTQVLDFDTALSEIQTYLPCRVDVTPYYKPENLILLQYNGTVKGLLDEFTRYYNLSWEYDLSGVSIFRLKQQSYKILAGLGQMTATGELTNANTSSSSGSDSSVSTAEGKGVHTSTLKLSADQWEDIDNNLRGLLSEEGSVTINRTAGLVNIKDTPWVHKSVKKYINRLNEEISKQVVVSVKVLNYEITNSKEYGFDADLSFRNLGEEYSLGLSTLTDAATTTAAAAVSSGVLTGSILESASGKLGTLTGSQVFLEALRSRGKLSVEREAFGRGLNNTIFPLQDVFSKGFIENTKVTTDDDIIETELNPASLVTGFSMIVSPHILNNDNIIFRYNISLSTEGEMNTWEVGGSMAQKPNFYSRGFSNGAALKSGETLILAGFTTKSDSVEKNTKLLGLDNQGESTRSMIIIMVTVTRVEGARA
tara:strand:+ start:365 stop:1894 length:1530 start_codon:yes stop_codon:yes gene_type:complete